MNLTPSQEAFSLCGRSERIRIPEHRNTIYRLDLLPSPVRYNIMSTSIELSQILYLFMTDRNIVRFLSATAGIPLG